MADVENVIKAWNCCNPINRKCKECPYEKDCYHDGISRHMVANAISVIKELQAEIERLEKENGTLKLAVQSMPNWLDEKRPEVVRCKDCKHRGDNSGYCYNEMVDSFVKEDWYCADGERKDGEIYGQGGN